MSEIDRGGALVREVRFDKKGRQIGMPPMPPPTEMPRPKSPPLNRHQLMAQPIRRTILGIFDADRRLKASPVDLFRHRGMTGLPEVKGLTVTKVSYHTRALAESGMLTLVDLIKVRGTFKHVYSLSTDGRAFLDGPELLLEKMAMTVQRDGNDPERAYRKLIELLELSGRDVRFGRKAGEDAPKPTSEC